MKKSGYSILLFWYLLLASAIRGGDSYVLLVGGADTGVIDLFNINWDGTEMNFRSSFDIRDDFPEFYDPTTSLLPISVEGKYILLREGGSNARGILYSIDQNYEFHALQTFPDGSTGGGFTKDNAYFFTTTGTRILTQEIVQLQAYRLDGDSATLVLSEDVPTSASLYWNIYVTSQDELLGTSEGGGWPRSYTAYQFDRESETLTLTRYGADIYAVGPLSHDESFFIGSYRNEIRSHVRGGEENYFQLQSTYWNSDWVNAFARYTRLTPDSRYALVPISSIMGDSGAAVFGFTEDKSLYLHYFHPEIHVDQLAVSPDGRLVAISHHASSSIKNLSIYRLTDDGRLVETARYGRSNWIFGLEFLPQARPTSADPAVWSQYSEAEQSEPPTVHGVPFPKPNKTVANGGIHQQR